MSKAQSKQEAAEDTASAKATPSAQSVATDQLDSDDEDISKRSTSRQPKRRKKNNDSKEQQRLRQERKQLYQIQEQKRRRREDVTCAQGRRSKELKDGKTPRQQKVERLRTERKMIDDEYSGASMKKKKQKKRKHNIPLPSKK